MLATYTGFSQILPLVALTRFRGVCFRSQRLRLARLRGEFSDGFLTVVATTGMLVVRPARCCSDVSWSRPRRSHAINVKVDLIELSIRCGQGSRR